MKPQEQYQELIQLAEKMGIQVSEQNFRSTGLRAKSGMVVLKGKPVYLMNKHNKINKKIHLLSKCLSEHPHEDIYMVPAIRELLMQHIDGQLPLDEADDDDDDGPTDQDESLVD